MNITSINATKTSFKGLLTISGPNKEKDVIINTNNISTILKHPYFDKKEDSPLGIGAIYGAIITMNNGTNIKTFLSNKDVIEAYKKAETTNAYTLKTKYDPLVTKPLLFAK